MVSSVFFLLALAVAAQGALLELSCEEKRAFVNGHNLRRLLAAKGEIPGQPAASEMKIMMWDDELYKKASKWASKHRNYHNPDKTVPSGRFLTGENLYWFGSTNRTRANHFEPDSSLEDWYSEYKNYIFGPLVKSDFDGSKDYEIGHYTQMVWSDSVYVGCGIGTRSKNGWYHVMVVCNYGPGGNYIDETPYKIDGGASEELICGVHDCSRLYGASC